MVWYQIRGQMEDFHSTDTFKELSQDDMMDFNIKTINLLTDFYNNRYGIAKKDVPELSKLIMDNVPEIVGKVKDKKLLLSGIKSGINSGVDYIKLLKTPLDVLNVFIKLPPYVMGKYFEYSKKLPKK